MQNKGSTLLLAMVIISTVLFAGIGAGIIVSRQVRQMTSVENKEIGFYVAQSIADAISLEKDGFKLTDEFENVNWSDMGIKRDVMYKAKEVGNNYIIMMKVGNEYYRFVKEVGKEDGVKEEDIVISGEKNILLYYKKPEVWGDGDVNVSYKRWHNNGGWTDLGTVEKKMEASELFGGWMFTKVKREIDGKEVKFLENVKFCREGEVECSVSSNYEDINEKSLALGKENTEALFFTLLYYKKPEVWGDGDVTISYRRWHYNGGWTNLGTVEKKMEASNLFEGWSIAKIETKIDSEGIKALDNVSFCNDEDICEEGMAYSSSDNIINNILKEEDGNIIEGTP